MEHLQLEIIVKYFCATFELVNWEKLKINYLSYITLWQEATKVTLDEVVITTDNPVYKNTNRELSSRGFLQFIIYLPT